MTCVFSSAWSESQRAGRIRCGRPRRSPTWAVVRWRESRVYRLLRAGCRLVFRRAGRKTLVESWNGSTWSVVPSHRANVGTNELTKRVVYVNHVLSPSGGPAGASGHQDFDRIMGRGTWTVVAGPPSSSIECCGVLSVSCVSGPSCKAVGVTASSGRKTLILSGSSSAWSVSRK